MKTRILQEFSRALAAHQPPSDYWPASLLTELRVDGLRLSELPASRKTDRYRRSSIAPEGAQIPWPSGASARGRLTDASAATAFQGLEGLLAQHWAELRAGIGQVLVATALLGPSFIDMVPLTHLEQRIPALFAATCIETLLVVVVFYGPTGERLWNMPKWPTAVGAVVALAVLVLVVVSVVAWCPAPSPSAGVGPAPQQVILSGIESIAGNVRLTTHIGAPLPPSPQCPGRSAVWDDSDQRPTVAVFLLVAQCTSLESARDAQWSSVNSARQGEGTIGLPPAVPYAWQGQGTPYAEWPAGEMQQLIFRRGIYYVEITGYMATSRGGDASSLIRAVAVAQSRQLTGVPGPGAESFHAAELDGVPAQASVLTFLALAVWLLAGYIRRKRNEPQARTVRPGGSAFDVTPAARRAARTARWSVVSWMAALVALSGLTRTPSDYFFSAFGLAAACIALWLRRRAAWKLRPEGRYSCAAATETGTLLLAAALVIAAMLALALSVGLGDAGPELALTGGRVDPSVLTDEPLWRWMAALPVNLAAADFLALAALLAVAASWAWSRAARLGGAAAAVSASASPAGRPSERVPIRTSALGRVTLAERIGLRQFEAFDAVASRLVGSAASRGLTVINAAPPFTVAPLQPELAAALCPANILLLFPPLPAHEIWARWEIFRRRNAGFPGMSDLADWAEPLDLAEPPDPANPPDPLGGHADRILLARWSQVRGWQCWHADVKTEWAYAAASAQALSTLAPAAPPSSFTGHVPVGPLLEPGVPESRTAPEHPQYGQRSPEPVGMVELSEPTGKPVPPEPDTGSMRPRRRRVIRLPSVRWRVGIAAIVAAAVVTVNVVASLVTGTTAHNVSEVISQYLLQPGAVGGGLTLVTDTTVPGSKLRSIEPNGVRCAQRLRIWASDRGKLPDLKLEVKLTGCWPPGIIGELQADTDSRFKATGYVVPNDTGIPYAVVTAAPATLGGVAYHEREAVFRGGPVAASVILMSRKPLTATQLSTFRQTAREQLAALPWPAASGTGVTDIGALGGKVGRWVLNIFLYAIILASVWGWWVRRRYSLKANGPRPPTTERVTASNVAGSARWAAWLTRGRFALQIAGGFCLLSWFDMPAPAKYPYVLTGAVLVAVALFVRYPGLGRPLASRLRAGVLTGQRTVTALTLALLTAAAAALALGLAIFGLFFLVLQFSGAVMGSGRLDPGLLGSEPAEQALSLVPVRLIGADFLLAAVGAAIAVPACYLAARRVAALTADEATRREPGQEILYLRNFADDDIQMPTSRLSRNSLVERIAVYRTERFEEVLVRRLARFGPVTAVNPPGLEKPPIGAARMNMANADWQKGVQGHIVRAQLIVVGAAPERTTKGLAWELAEIQKAGALAKTLLVLPPLPVEALHARWALFRAMTPSYLLPPELDWGTDQHLVLVASGPGRWRTWHARRRTEWAYAVALRAAALALVPALKASELSEFDRDG